MNSEAKHTPGPWKVTAPDRGSPDQQGDRLIHTKDGRHVAETFQYQNDEHPDELSESIANAHLIAAAPAMKKRLILAQRLLLQDDKQGALNELEAGIAGIYDKEAIA